MRLESKLPSVGPLRAPPASPPGAGGGVASPSAPAPPRNPCLTPRAWTSAGPATKSAANDIPATSAVRFIAQCPSTQMRQHPATIYLSLTI